MAISVLYWVVFALCWAYALTRGGSPARWAFVFYVAATGITVAALLPPSDPLLQRWIGLNLILLLADALLFVGLLAIALTSRRYWPIWAAGFQLASVLTHFGPLLDPNASPKIYRALEAFWALPILASMVAGIRLDHIRGQRNDRANHP